MQTLYSLAPVKIKRVLSVGQRVRNFCSMQTSRYFINKKLQFAIQALLAYVCHNVRVKGMKEPLLYEIKSGIWTTANKRHNDVHVRLMIGVHNIGLEVTTEYPFSPLESRIEHTLHIFALCKAIMILQKNAYLNIRADRNLINYITYSDTATVYNDVFSEEVEHIVSEYLKF